MLKQVQNTNKRKINCNPYVWIVYQGFFSDCITLPCYIKTMYIVKINTFFSQLTTVSPPLLLLQFFLLHVVTRGRTDKILISLNPIPVLHKHIPYPFYWMHVPEASANVFPSLFWFLAGYHSFCVLASLFPSPALGIFSLFKREWGRNGSILGWNEKWWEMDCLNLNTPP